MAHGKPTRGMGWVAFKVLTWRVEEPGIGFGVILTTPSKPAWGF